MLIVVTLTLLAIASSALLLHQYVSGAFSDIDAPAPTLIEPEPQAEPTLRAA